MSAQDRVGVVRWLVRPGGRRRAGRPAGEGGWAWAGRGLRRWCPKAGPNRGGAGMGGGVLPETVAAVSHNRRRYQALNRLSAAGASPWCTGVVVAVRARWPACERCSPAHAPAGSPGGGPACGERTVLSQRPLRPRSVADRAASARARSGARFGGGEAVQVGAGVGSGVAGQLMQGPTLVRVGGQSPDRRGRARVVHGGGDGHGGVDAVEGAQQAGLPAVAGYPEQDGVAGPELGEAS